MEYFCSQISRNLLENLTSDYIWMRTLQNQPEASLIEPLCTSCTKEFFHVSTRSSTGTSSNTNTGGAQAPSSTARRGTSGGGGRMIPRLANTSTGSTGSSMEQSQSLDGNKSRTDELNSAIDHLKDIASEQLAESTLLETKKFIFS